MRIGHTSQTVAGRRCDFVTSEPIKFEPRQNLATYRYSGSDDSRDVYMLSNLGVIPFVLGLTVRDYPKIPVF